MPNLLEFDHFDHTETSKKEIVKKRYIRFDEPPSIHESLPILDNKTKGLKALDFNPANDLSLAKMLEVEVNKAQAAGNQTLVDELNGIILCFMQLRNQCGEIHTKQARELHVVKLIMHRVLGMWNQ